MGSNFNVEGLLKENGLKTTKQRVAILGLLAETALPMDAELIFDRLKDRLEGCNLSTVYRNMEVLLNKNVVSETTMGLKSYFALNRNEHCHYVRCLSCHQVTVVSGCPFVQYERQLENELGYKMLGHKVELYGICSSCQS